MLMLRKMQESGAAEVRYVDISNTQEVLGALKGSICSGLNLQLTLHLKLLICQLSLKRQRQRRSL